METNSAIEENLSGRKDALEAIATALATNAQAVEERLSGLTEILSGTLNSTEERIAALGESLSRRTEESTEAASSLLESTIASADERVAAISEALGRRAEDAARAAIGQFETMRLAASAEGKRAVESVEAARAELEEQLNNAGSRSEESVRTAARRLVEEITQAVGEATSRFGETAEDMRRAARDLQKELDETRSELRRGVLDLPDEARETTSAMRRAVSEQIEAINELSGLVARYAPDLDTSAPPVLASVNPRPEPVQEKPQRMREPDDVEADVEMERTARVASASGRMVRSTDIESELRTPVRPQRRAATPPASESVDGDRLRPAQQPRSGTGEARGWVADLLRRASTEEDGDHAVPSPARPGPAAPSGDRRSPSQVVDSLNSLSVDIARAIDHEASVELWDRYKRGERNVFTRRLYTLQGQKTFDEIRRKYERDGDFRNAVDQYIDDFERLLKQVSQNDDDQMMSQMYLTSDTGKVYTMLAHAAGRLS
jgi:hypothetical protein